MKWQESSHDVDQFRPMATDKASALPPRHQHLVAKFNGIPS
jgi:hypothetical protein